MRSAVPGRALARSPGHKWSGYSGNYSFLRSIQSTIVTLCGIPAFHSGVVAAFSGSPSSFTSLGFAPRPSVGGLRSRGRTVAPCSLHAGVQRHGFASFGRVKRQAVGPQVSCSGGCKAPRSVSGTPRVQRRTGASVTRRHSFLTGFRLIGPGAAGAAFCQHDAGASLRAAAVTTCRWR